MVEIQSLPVLTMAGNAHFYEHKLSRDGEMCRLQKLRLARHKRIRRPSVFDGLSFCLVAILFANPEWKRNQLENNAFGRGLRTGSGCHGSAARVPLGSKLVGLPKAGSHCIHPDCQFLTMGPQRQTLSSRGCESCRGDGAVKCFRF